MRVTTHLMFQGALPEALAFYARVLPDFDVSVTQTDAAGNPVAATGTLAGHSLSFYNSPPAHDFGFTPATSLFLRVTDRAEVDRLAEALGEGGRVLMPLDTYDFAPRFAWIEDRFGVSWQIMQAP